ncbi:class I SAM-dependent RNA methyltransferase [Microbacterium sp. LjRoot45]|uniref:class I SAM-dependent RNA methyltransferase n=1 Tax=Microbacterium sp. LjRoot45 TaxID=3342329 RepID=UPI003ECC783A
MPANEIELDVTDVAHGGVFVGRHQDEDSADRGGRVVFVPDAIPGERVRVRLTETGKASYWRGEVLEVLSASPHRRPHVWAQADVDVAPENRPGGADFGHIDLDHQRTLKTQVIRDALQRIGGLELPVTVAAARPLPGEPAAEDGAGWRTRVSVHVDGDGRIGPYAARSHRVIPTTELPLAVHEIAAAVREPRDAAPGRLDFVVPADGRVRVIARPHAADRRPRRGPRRGGTPAAPIDPAARETVVERVAGREFRVDAGGFWQVHRAAAHTLTAALGELLAGDVVDPDAWHLDLYGGVGLLAAAIGDAGGPATRVTTVESDPRATEHAGENLAEWVGARAETGRVDRWLRSLTASASAAERARLRAGVVVLDPPRAGAGRDVVEHIVELRPAHVAYVACDPVALARDLGTFAARGYHASAVHGFDLFPHSHHVEGLVLLTSEGVAR